jgi:periplasmic protein TonB
MKKLLFVALATSLAVSPTGIHAQEDGIVVSSGRSVDDFVNDVSRDLDRELNRIDISSPRHLENGVAQVLFECGPDGKPINVRLYKKSGFWTGLKARRVVSKIRSLHPLPQGVSHDQLYLANIIIADSPREFEELSEELEQLEKQRIASAKDGRKIFAFNLSKSPST